MKTNITPETLKSVYLIPVHSFIDLITNSSTETYIQATKKTISSVKEIINNLLLIGKSKYTSDDLFDITLDGDEDEYKNINLKVKAITGKNNDALLIETANLLSNLIDTLNIDSYYNG